MKVLGAAGPTGRMEPAKRRKEKPSLEVAAVAVRNVSKIYNNKWCYCYTFEGWPPAEILISFTEKKRQERNPEYILLNFNFSLSISSASDREAVDGLVFTFSQPTSK